MLGNAKYRAKRDALPFAITIDDIVIPDVCPILFIPLAFAEGRGGGGPGSPTLDRIHNHRGYVPGNVIVVSNRANRIKSDATLGELNAISTFYNRYR